MVFPLKPPWAQAESVDLWTSDSQHLRCAEALVGVRGEALSQWRALDGMAGDRFHGFPQGLPQLDVVGLPENVVYLLCNWENVGTWITSRFSVWQLDETDVVFWLDISSNLPIWTPWHVDPARRVNAKVFQLSVLAAQISVALPTTPRTFACDVACISVSFAPTRDSLAKRFHICATHMASGQHQHLTSFDHGSVLGSQLPPFPSHSQQP